MDRHVGPSPASRSVGRLRELRGGRVPARLAVDRPTGSAHCEHWLSGSPGEDLPGAPAGRQTARRRPPPVASALSIAPACPATSPGHAQCWPGDAGCRRRSRPHQRPAPAQRYSRALTQRPQRGLQRGRETPIPAPGSRGHGSSGALDERACRTRPGRAAWAQPRRSLCCVGTASRDLDRRPRDKRGTTHTYSIKPIMEPKRPIARMRSFVWYECSS
jgi:hypothetical protein